MNRLLLLGLLFPMILLSEELLQEDFNTDDLIPEGWTANSIEIMGEGDYHQMAQINAAADYLTTPTLEQPMTLECTVYVTSASPSFIIEISSDGINYHPHPDSPFAITPGSNHSFQLQLDPTTKNLKFSKSGAGTVYLDDIVISDDTPTAETVLLQPRQIEQQTIDNQIYAIKVNNASSGDLLLTDLNFRVQGLYSTEELAPLAFKIYQSDDLSISATDQLRSARGRCPNESLISFNLGTTLKSKQTTYLLITVDLSTYNYSQDIQHNLKLTPINNTGIFGSLTTGVSFNISQLSDIRDEFSNYDLSGWTSDGNFAIENPKDEGDGSTDYDNYATLASKDNAGHAVCIKPSPIAYGSWEFWIGEGNEWDTSGTNNYSVILISDTSEPTNLKYPTENFHGYFIKNDNYFCFCRQDGETTTTLFTFGLPDESSNGDSTNKQGGYSFRVIRDLAGEWKFYIDINNCQPTALRGTVLDNTYQHSVAFAVRTKIKNPELKRKLYFDNMTLKSYSKPTIELGDSVNSYFETIDGQTYIKWISTYPPSASFKVLYQDSENNWLESTENIQLQNGIYSLNITNNEAENWKLQCEIDEQHELDIHLQGSRNQILYSYQLEEGWNLVGPSGCELFENSLPKNSKCWTWSGHIYEQNLTCGLTKAMWIKSTQTEERPFVDSSVADEPMLNQGWNLISFNSNFTYDFSNLVLFYYQGGHYQVLDGPVKLFQGYWVYRAE